MDAKHEIGIYHVRHDVDRLLASFRKPITLVVRAEAQSLRIAPRPMGNAQGSHILVGNPTPVRGILEKILPEVLQNLPKAAGRGQILEGRGQDFFQQFRGMRGWILA